MYYVLPHNLAFHLSYVSLLYGTYQLQTQKGGKPVDHLPLQRVNTSS